MSQVSEQPTTGLLDDVELYTRIFRQMLLIRGFEDLVQSLFLKGEVYGTTHLYSGQEAIATGVASLLEQRDRVAATYRGHGHALALGVDPQALLDEMLGRESGVNGGRAGSMNVNAPDDRLIGSFGIVGGSIAAATGAALALKRTTGGLAVAFFGDGAMNQGYVFECLNFCQVLKLPLVLVCENNGYGEYTAFQSVTAGELRARAEVMEVPAETIDGMRVWAVRDAAARALEHARSGNGPAFIEALTYRFVGHSRSDPGLYRPEGELDKWKTRDPILAASRPARSGGRGSEPPRGARAGAERRARANARERARRAVPHRPGDPGVQGLRYGVARELTMPKLSDSTADAVIVRWLKSPGDSFARGEALIEVETDKATVVYEAESDGTLESILAPEGASVAIGEPIATLANGNGAAPRVTPPEPASRDGADAEQPNATPVARRTAVELGLSLHGIAGTGPGGRITREDVQRAAAEPLGSAQQPPRVRRAKFVCSS